MTTLNTPLEKRGMFVVDGKSLALTFALVSSLFLIWGFCNGMIDTMDKHFQDQLNLTKAQSAWVQFAHYMGYALMALPAGLLTRKIGYKGGIIFGLLMVALGGFWFMPATSINEFWAFLLGVCFIAMGLTVLETVANPYTTVLGPKEYGASRINLAQSCNGIGWILGPVAGGIFFYSAGGAAHAQGKLYIPYVGVGVLVLIIAALFFFAPVPDIKVEDEYQTDQPADNEAVPVTKERNRGLILFMIFLNVAALGLSLYLILNTILTSLGAVTESTILHYYAPAIGVAVVLVTLCLLPFARRVTSHSIWAHPHFSGATIAQFLYVAAQAGIFSFFINSMTVDKSNGYAMVPALPASWNTGFLHNWDWVETRTAIAPGEVKDFPKLATWIKNKATLEAAFINSQLNEATSAALNAYTPGSPVPPELQRDLVSELNRISRQELSNKAGSESNKLTFYAPERFTDAKLGSETQKQIDKLSAESQKNDYEILRLNRLALGDELPDVLPYHDSILAISDRGAAFLSMVAFGFFLLGRVSGSWFLKVWSAHRTLGAYALINVAVCGIIIAQLGWISVFGVFLSYLFMSIMYPTIFALGIFGLGSQSKKKAAAFIVMSITGGALMPKFMGLLGDIYNMSAAFWVPLCCFICIAVYSFTWPVLSGHESLHGLKTSGGH
ncbi:MAG: MFS transporter [Phycisphaerae bacterium]